MVVRSLAVLIAVAALVFALIDDHGADASRPLKVSGFVEADEIRVGSRVGGRVLRVLVAEGQAVAASEPLVQLEPFDLHERRAEAAAHLESAQAELHRLTAGNRAEEIDQARARRDQLEARLAELVQGPREPEIASARARVAEAEAQLALARLEYDRARVLEKESVESVGRLDRMTYSLRAAEAALDGRKNELALLELGTRDEEIHRARAELAEKDAAWELAKSGFRDEEIAIAGAAVAAAEAAALAIERSIEELVIRAGSAGVIQAIDLQPGDLVAPNAPVLALIDPSHLWVRAYVPENRLTAQIGQAVLIAVDTYPDRRFAGRVTFVSHAAEFTPSNVQTPEERSKQVFRIKVTLDDGLDVLHPGMSADVIFPTR